MRKVTLKPIEQQKYEIIKELVDHNGNKKRATVKLNCIIRTINRLNIKYKTEGKNGFIHKNKDRCPSNKISDSTKDKILNLYLQEYPNANISHFCEIVCSDLHISISDTTIRKWLFDMNISYPKAHRKTRKKLKVNYRLSVNNQR